MLPPLIFHFNKHKDYLKNIISIAKLEVLEYLNLLRAESKLAMQKSDSAYPEAKVNRL